MSRAALVGTAIGVVEILILVGARLIPDEESALWALLAMAVVPFPLGLLLGRAARLRLWGFVGIFAPFAMFAFVSVAMIPVFPADDRWWVGAIFVSATAGFLVTAWLFTEGSWVPRVFAAGAMLLSYVAVPLAGDAIRESERIRQLKNSGVPLIAAVIPGYQLTRVMDIGQSVELTYEHGEFSDSGYSEISIDVRPATSATPEAACARPLPHRADESSIPCRRISADVWVRTEATHVQAWDKARLAFAWTEATRRSVFARRGDALVMIESYEACEAELLAVLSTFRPTTAEELVAVE
ncbi:hypothetical protein Misp02_35940 [Microtetraspora sp. NBRC 16547]|nr:hypothetical protein Misp02_35940 [Microtetraspora sp. NBRC 16547]